MKGEECKVRNKSQKTGYGEDAIEGRKGARKKRERGDEGSNE